MNAHPNRLPEELLSIIVDYVDETKEKRLTFSCLALVNTTLLALVRQKRSSEIVICPTLYKRPIHHYLQRLSSIIRLDPSFGACVTSLTLVDNASRSLGGASYGWLMNSEATDELPDILGSLVSLKSLVLRNSVVDMFIDWQHVDVAVQDALFDLFSSRTLRSLALCSIINMELTPLIDCSNLKELTLRSVSLCDDDLEPVEDWEVDPEAVGATGEGPSIEARGRLEYLEVGDCGVALEKLVEGFARDDARLDISSLKILKVHATLYSDAMDSALKALLDVSGPSIEELYFRMHLDFNSSKSEQRVLGCLNFHDLPLLSVLDIEFVVNMLHCHPIPQPHIENIFSAVESTTKDSLRNLRLNFLIQPLGHFPFLSTDASSLARSILNNNLWARLNSLSEKVLGRMDSIEVVIMGERWMSTATGKAATELVHLVGNLEREMPDLVSRGLLSVSWTDEE